MGRGGGVFGVWTILRALVFACVLGSQRFERVVILLSL